MNIQNEAFSDRLLSEIDRKKSVAVVGLDPVYHKIPLPFRVTAVGDSGDTFTAVAESIISFNKCIIDVVEPYVPAVKPQIAFYERYGIEGIRAFVETVKYARKKSLIVIEDAKRNDIGNTAQAYANGHLGKVKVEESSEKPVFDVDAITLNPYLGSDSIYPFVDSVKKYGKGIFILVKTSNPSSSEIQDVLLGNNEGKLFEYIARLVNKWGMGTTGHQGYSSVGAVVGATFPRHAKALRLIMPTAIFLVPGYGAQGAKAKDIVACYNEDGYGAVISASRSINYPHGRNMDISVDSFKSLVKKAIDDMNNDIFEALSANKLVSW